MSRPETQQLPWLFCQRLSFAVDSLQMQLRR